MKTLAGVAAAVAFLFALGIVGAVEQGAELSRMLWTLPALGVMALAVRTVNRGRRSRPCNKRMEVEQCTEQWL